MQRALAGPRTERPPARGGRGGAVRASPVLRLSRLIGNRAVVQLMRDHGAVMGPLRDAAARTRNQAFMSIKAEKQGAIRGDVTQHGEEGRIEVRELSWSVKAPKDVATGQSAGRRQYGELRFRKDFDGASVALVQALTTNERLTEVTVEFLHPSLDGKQKAYQRLTLTGATVAEFSQATDDDGNESERVGLRFETIKIENLDRQTAASDTAATPR